MSTKDLIGWMFFILVIANSLLLFTFTLMGEMGAAEVCFYINNFFCAFGIGVLMGSWMERDL
jgi:hypothetical protein